MKDVLTALAGGHVFNGTWEALGALSTATCEACGEHVKIDGKLLWQREEGAAGVADEGLCAGWQTPHPAALDRLVRSMISETNDEQPSGPTEAAIVATHEAHVHVLKLVLPLVTVPSARRALREEGDRIADLTSALADDARALRLAYEAGQRGQAPPAPAERVTAEELAEVARLDAAATPGPWRLDEREEDTGNGTWTRRRVCELDGYDVLNGGGSGPDEADGALMARARTLLPKLAAEVTALRAHLASCNITLADEAARIDDLRKTLADIASAVLQAGIDEKPGDTVGTRVGRLIADADEQSKKLEALREKARALGRHARRLREDERDDVERAVPTGLVQSLVAEIDKP